MVKIYRVIRIKLN